MVLEAAIVCENPMGKGWDAKRPSVQGARRLSQDAGHVQENGFSEAMIDRFFRPFLGGIFFDNNLNVTSRLFRFVMRMLATGSNCLPANGIGAVADQLAAGLPQGSIQTGAAPAHFLSVLRDRFAWPSFACMS